MLVVIGVLSAVLMSIDSYCWKNVGIVVDLYLSWVPCLWLKIKCCSQSRRVASCYLFNYLLVVLYLFNCCLNFCCKILRIDIANKICLMLKIICSIEPHLLIALHLYKFCNTLQVWLTTQCTQCWLNCCSDLENEPTPNDTFFAPGTRGFSDGSF